MTATFLLGNDPLCTEQYVCHRLHADVYSAVDRTFTTQTSIVVLLVACKSFYHSQTIPMPTDYACKTCDLRFSVGWFHYHLFETGYGSETLLVCTACGTQHSIQIALRNRGPEFHELHDVELTHVPKNDRLFALRLIRDNCTCAPNEAIALLDHLPVCLAERVHPYQVQEWIKRVSKTAIVLNFPVVERKPNESYGPVLQDRLHWCVVPLPF